MKTFVEWFNGLSYENRKKISDCFCQNNFVADAVAMAYNGAVEQMLKKYLPVTIRATGQKGIIVDCSDAHGLCYGVIFPNEGGALTRVEACKIFWYELIDLDF
jgi:hypothetical protein